MRSWSPGRWSGLGLAALLAAPAWGQAPAAPSGPPAAPSGPPEPAVQRSVTEDDGVRIEELKVRGQTQRIVVRTKGSGANTYEIVPADASRDPSAGPTASRGAAGQRVWHVFSF